MKKIIKDANCLRAVCKALSVTLGVLIFCQIMLIIAIHFDEKTIEIQNQTISTQADTITQLEDSYGILQSQYIKTLTQHQQEKTPVKSQLLGEYKLTYYCPCEKCCGSHGKNRPKVNGKFVVETASGAFAQEGITVAVDPRVIPYGTILYIEGVGYRIAQDCGGAVKGAHLDIYTKSHEEAAEKGVSSAKVYIVE